MDSVDSDERIDYTSKEYWDKRYSSNETSYDWYSDIWELLFNRTMDYNTFKVFDIDRFVKRTDLILFPGCGNSCQSTSFYLLLVMCRDMYIDGYHHITAFDYSETVINRCIERDKECSSLRCSPIVFVWTVDEIMDCFKMTYPPSSFDVVIDKSTLDTFLCSEDLFNRIPEYLSGIANVLKQNGKLMLISINPPEAVLEVYLCDL